LLSVEDLTMHYFTSQGEVKAVDGISFSLKRGQSMGLVGESGCGKSSIAISLLKLLPDNGRLISGRVMLDGVDLVQMSETQIQKVRWNRISIVFQAAMNSLDPVYKVGDQIIEAIETHMDLSRSQADQKVRDLFELVGLDSSFINRYPHEYSGGMKQRAVIAMALSCDPDIIIADEPTTALDVIVQDKILREIREIQKRFDMSMIYISHDMAVIAEVSDITGVMYAGKLVELGETVEIFQRPIHPYTQALMSAFPSVTGEKHELTTLPGEPPNLIDPPKGCRFNPRCLYATDICREEEPPIVRRGEHWAACWNPLA
ncbi:MAG: ABC transporter ATP-binding protein, partial [Chloroflexi bacterium]|nr:ABC transporter ATP-binding protein [Chloroflexota bacterium]